MTNYEHWESRANDCEERCRNATDGWMRSFWARTADFCQSVLARMTATQAASEWEETGEHL